MDKFHINLLMFNTVCDSFLLVLCHIQVGTSSRLSVAMNLVSKMRIITKLQVLSQLCCAQSLQLCPILCNPMDCSLPGSFVHGILQARIVEWIAMSSSKWSTQPRNRTHISGISCIADGFFTCRVTWEAVSTVLIVLKSMGDRNNNQVYNWRGFNGTFKGPTVIGSVFSRNSNMAAS